jgi:hypothetical protein
MGSGYFNATVSYDWTKNAFKVEYKTSNNYVEYYQFNPQRGYDPNVGTGQFTYQYLYKTSTGCKCEISSLQFGMPAWFYDAPNQAPPATPTLKYWGASQNPDYTLSVTKASTKYLPNPNFQLTNKLTGTTRTYNLGAGFWIDPIAKKPAGFALVDTAGQIRTFTVSKISEVTSAALALVEPQESCPCEKLVDIVMSLDRSGSIDTSQWKLEYDFIKNVAAQFSYGPLGANLGIGNWNAQHWRTLDLPSGTSKTVVDNAIASMTCCPGTNAPSCCCCGTPIGGGLFLGNNMLKLGRPEATKVLIILTDGCQNHLWNEILGKAVSCGCSSELICAQNTTCTGDISKYYQVVKNNFPGVTIIAVGVGGADAICPDQLRLAAGGDTANVYNPTDWSQLQTIVKTIASTACSQNAVPCTGCCGLCTCGKCIPAPNCKDSDACNLGVLDTSLACCRTDPKQCNPPPCNSATCDKVKGCVNTPLVCKPSSDPCFEYACNATTVICLRRPNATAPPSCTGKIITECVNNSDCNRGDPCTVYTCAAGKCTNSPLDCGKSDNCTTRYCKPTVGCFSKDRTCDDSNNCTTDACIPSTGCVYTPKPPCTQPKSECIQTICDPVKGCINVPANCSAKGYVPSKVNCTVPACNTTCYNKYICVAPTPFSAETFPQTVILASALGTAAIVGIVIAAAVLLAGLGTAAGVAIVGAAGAGGVALVAHNPTYVPSGAAGNNVLYKNE